MRDLWSARIWVAWQTETIGGRKAKAPYAPGGTAYAKSDAPETWGTRLEAADRATRLTRPEGLGGVGVMFTEVSPGIGLGGVDLDACREPVSGTLAPWAQEIVDRLGSYTEVSPSNIGVKVFFLFEIGPVEEAGVRGKTVRRKGDVDRLKDPGIEFYIERRYFTVTDQQSSATDELRVVSVEDLAWLVEVAIPAFSGREGPRMTRSATPAEAAGAPAVGLIDDIRDALRVIPNDDEHWDRWSEVGMAVYRATEGSSDGFDAFKVWSQKATVYDEAAVRERWDHWKRSPPDRSGIGSLLFWANQADPGWIKPSEREGIPSLTDQMMAITFAEREADGLRYTAAFGKWNAWDGQVWRPDDTLEHHDRAKRLAREYATNAPQRLKKDVASARTVSAILTLSRSDRRLAASSSTWDRDPWLLGTRGGTVDLRTGELREGWPSDMITCAAPAPPGAAVPAAWLAFLNDITQGSAERIAYLQRIAGYFATGTTREEKLFFAHGGGRNGKGTFIETVGKALGTYATTVAMSTLVQTRFAEHPTEIAKLKGTRLAIASESSDGMRWNAQRIKLLTGGDRLTGRFMRADFFDFDPSHKLFVSSNEKPLLGKVDVAIAARLEMIPFLVTFDNPDRTLKERLGADLGGVLRWIVDGCLEWQRIGLATPADIAAATDQYLHDQDDISIFLDDCTFRSPGKRTPMGDIYRHWVEWADRNGAYPGSRKALISRLEAVSEKRGFRFAKSSVLCLEGIEIGEPTGATEEQAKEGFDF